MKFQTKIYALVIAVIMFSCSQEEFNQIEPNDFNLYENIKINSSTSSLSKTTFKAGASRLNVETNQDKTFYTFETNNEFILNNDFHNLGDYTFFTENNVLKINGNDDFFITLKDNYIYIKTPEYSGQLKNFNTKIDDEISIMMLVLNELTIERENFKNYSDYSSRKLMCSIGGTYVRFSINTSRSASEAELAGDTWSQEGCSKVGGVDTSCAFWSDHGCISTQTYCCD